MLALNTEFGGHSPVKAFNFSNKMSRGGGVEEILYQETHGRKIIEEPYCKDSKYLQQKNVTIKSRAPALTNKVLIV